MDECFTSFPTLHVFPSGNDMNSCAHKADSSVSKDPSAPPSNTKASMQFIFMNLSRQEVANSCLKGLSVCKDPDPDLGPAHLFYTDPDPGL